MPKTSSIKIGDKYGYYTVLEKAGKLKSKPRRSLWKCECKCGTIKLVDAGNLKKPGRKSCGCLRQELAKEKGKKQRTEKSYFNLLYGECKRTAKYRKKEFNLTKSEYKTIVIKNCYYCDTSPTITRTKVGIPVPTNGLDRINNSIGYTKENCVSCCKICNTMKSTLEVNKFYDHIEKILEFRKNGN